MKNQYIFLLILFFSFFSCKKVSSEEFELNAEQITQNDIIGVIKYTDEVYGDVYLQFQNDGKCKQLSYYEGTNIWEGSWAIENNVMSVTGDNIWIPKSKPITTPTHFGRSDFNFFLIVFDRIICKGF